MATTKSYTNINQSKKLVEILPLESADMHYSKDFDGSWFVDLAEYTSVKIPKYVGNIEEHLLPCWSLAALMEVMPESIADDKNELIAYMSIYKYDSLWVCAYDYENQEDGNYISFSKESFVDACYEMILKLHELKMLRL